MAEVFPATSLSALARVKSDDPVERAFAWEQLARIYYKPVYKHLRLRWNKSAEDAEDLTQHFFAEALEREIFSSYDGGRARFRTFVRVCVDRLAMNQHAAAQARKRGGGMNVASIESREAEAELALMSHDAREEMDRIFDREWARSVFEVSIARLKARLAETGRTHLYEAFACYDLADSPPSYAELAEKLGTSVTTVTNHLATARKLLRTVTFETLRELTASDEEFEEEARSLLGTQRP